MWNKRNADIIWTILVEVYKMKLHTKYQSPEPSIVTHIFLKFFVILICKTSDPRAIIWTGLLRTITTAISEIGTRKSCKQKDRLVKDRTSIWNLELHQNKEWSPSQYFFYWPFHFCRSAFVCASVIANMTLVSQCFFFSSSFCSSWLWNFLGISK